MRRVGPLCGLRLGRYFALSPIYQFVATQYYPGVHTRENRLSINGVVSVPIKRLVVDNMHQFEQRFREPGNSNRYRTRVQVEWPFRFHDADYRLFSWEEVAYDWSPSCLDSQSHCGRRWKTPESKTCGRSFLLETERELFTTAQYQRNWRYISNPD